MDLSDQERLFRQRKKWLWGCTGGCLGLMLVGAGAIIGVWMWFAHAQPVPQAEAFLTSDTAAFLFVRIAPDDPMMVEVPVRLAMQPAIRDRVPTKEGEQAQLDPERMRAAVVGVGPMQLVAVATLPDGRPPLRWGVGASISRFGRLLNAVVGRLVVNQDEPAAEPYKGGAILMAQDGSGGFAIRANTYMVAEDKALLRSWLDGIQADLERLEQAGAGEPHLPADMDPQLLAAYDELDRGSPVRFACLNGHGEILALLEKLPSEAVRTRLAAAGMAGPGVLRVSGQLQSMNSRDAALTLRVACADEKTAADVEAVLSDLTGNGERTPHLRDPLIQRQDGLTVELTARIENLPDRVAELVNLPPQED